MVLGRMESCGVVVHPNLILQEVCADSFDLVSSYGVKTYRKEAI
jgi:hypothetical protein